MNVCMCVCAYVCMYECIYVCTYVCMYACMYVCLYICMHVCMRVYMQQVFARRCNGVFLYTYQQCLSVCTVCVSGGCEKGGGVLRSLPTH